jgi:hypothetical protein
MTLNQLHNDRDEARAHVYRLRDQVVAACLAAAERQSDARERRYLRNAAVYFQGVGVHVRQGAPSTAPLGGVEVKSVDADPKIARMDAHIEALNTFLRREREEFVAELEADLTRETNRYARETIMESLDRTREELKLMDLEAMG